MRRTGLLVSGWAVATVLALMLGLLGVRAVSDSVTTRRTQILSPASVRAALSSSSSSESESAQSEQSASAAAESEAPGSSSSSSGASASGASDAQNGATGIGDAEQESSSVFSAPSAPQSSFSSGGGDGSGDNESSSAAPTTTTVDRTYSLVGGTVRVRFANGTAQFLWATVNDGFTEETNSTSPEVDVRFRSETHESDLKAYWDNGPQADIQEHADGDG